MGGPGCRLGKRWQTVSKGDVSRERAARNACNISYGLHSPQVTFIFDERDKVYSL